MVFNEILIPQNFFTETNVTRKRVRRRKIRNHVPKPILLKSSHLITCFYMFENTGVNNMLEQCVK